jgi:hypothetical protein
VANSSDELPFQSPAVNRALAAGANALPWLIGPAVMILRSRPVELAPPASCPGLLELFAAVAFRAGPDLAAGLVFAALNVVCVTVALALFVLLARRAHIRTSVAVSAALAIGLGPLFPPVLAPPSAATAFAVCDVVALLTLVMLDSGGAAGRFRTAAALSVLAGLLVPSWIVGLAVLWGAAVLVAGRATVTAWFTAIAGAGAVAASAAAVWTMLPLNALNRDSIRQRLGACVIPSVSTARISEIAAAAASSLGPFALALALLGAFAVLRARPARRRLLPVVAALGSLVVLSSRSMPVGLLLAPCAAGLWFLAASGLDDMLQPGARSARLGGAILLAALPVLQVSRFRAEERDDQVRPSGHERATLRQLTAFLNNVPSGAVFVEEDATFDTLWRAVFFAGRRPSRRFTVVPRDPARVRQALAGQPVFAFSGAWAYLTIRGFSAEAYPVAVRVGRGLVKTGGMAAITGWSPCAVVADRWVDLRGGIPSGRFSIVADSEQAHGPISVILGGVTAVDPRPDGWPLRTTRGFHARLFDMRSSEASAQLRQQARELRLPESDPALASSIVVHLELHRTPKAPLALAITLGAPFPVGAIKRQPTPNDGGTLTVCDIGTAGVTPFGAVLE